MSYKLIIGSLILLGLFGLTGLITKNIIMITILIIIVFLLIPLILINKCIIKYLITKRTISRGYLHKLSKYIYTTIHYEMNRIYEIKNKINDLHKTYYKYYSYSYVITNIEKELILFKEEDLTKLMVIDINKQKLLLSQPELQELIIMKLNGLKTDMIIYKNYLRNFFKSLNDFNEDLNEIISFV